MTEEEFKKIILPLELMDNPKHIPFMRTMLMGNYNTWRKEKQALDLASVSQRIYILSCARKLSQDSWTIGVFANKDTAEEKMNKLDNNRDYNYSISEQLLYGG